MTDEEKRALLRRAVSLWGTMAQWNMVVEETSEMNAMINRVRRGRATTDQLAEEVADATIMLEQARLMVGEGLVDRYIDKKLERLRMRIVDGEQKLKKERDKKALDD